MTLQNAFEGLATEAKQDDVVTSVDGVSSRLPAALGTAGGLKVAIVSGSTAGGATETTMVAIRDLIDALATATETQPVSGPLTDAQLRAAVVPVSVNGVASEATLSSLSGKVGTPSADDLLSLLRDIRTNTGQEITAVQNLKLTADQVNLNTDTLESLLGTTNSRLGTTGVAGSVAALLDAIRINQSNQAVNATLMAPADISDRVGRLLGHVTIDNASLAVTGPLTDAQLRASALPVALDLSTLATAAAQASQSTLLTAIRDKDFATEASLAALSAKYPAVAALADALVNPSLTKMGSFLHGYNGVTWDRLRSDITNGLDVDVTRLPGSVTDTGTITASGQSVTANVRAGMNSVAIAFYGTYAGITFNFEASFDGATTWHVFGMKLGHSTTGGVIQSSTVTNGINWYQASIPPGATHIRLRASAYTSGTMNVVIGQSPQMGESITALGTGTLVALSSGQNGIGFVRASGFWADETSTPLAAAGTFTGVSYDMAAQASGSNLNASTSAAKELRAIAISDVAGTLCLEVSRDSTTWRRVYSVAMSNANTDVVGAGGAIYKAEIQHIPATRYARLVFVNGAGAQTHFMLQSMRLGA